MKSRLRATGGVARVAWIDKIIKLLNHHQIQTAQPDKQLWVLMHGKDDGKVHFALMQQLAGVSVPAR